MATSLLPRRIALFVDLDNGQIQAEQLGLKRCTHSLLWPAALVRLVATTLEGEVDVRRTYGDAMHTARRVFRENVWKVKDVRERIQLDADIHTAWLQQGFRFFHTPPLTGHGKNGADIQLALDALQLAHEAPDIDTFAVLSADTDFSSLVSRLRRLGREVAVITVGRPHHQGMPSLLALATHHLVYDQQAVDRAGPLALQAALQDLAVEHVQQNVPIQAVAEQMRACLPGAQPTDLGFRKLEEMILACRDDLIVEHGKVSRRPTADETRLHDLRSTSTTPPSKPEPLSIASDTPLPTALRKVSLPPRVHALRAVIHHLTASDPDDPILTQKEAVARLATRGHSKSAVRDAWRTLLVADCLDLSDSEDTPLFERRPERLHPNFHERIVAMACRRLDDADYPHDRDAVAQCLIGSEAPAEE